MTRRPTSQASDAEILARLVDGEIDATEAEAADPDLQSLAEVTEAVAALKPVEPPPRKLRPGRAAFIAAGVRRAEDAGITSGLLVWLMGHLRLATAATAMALALVVGLASVAAADSLPGDPLYPVKRAEERIRWQLADGLERNRLAETFDHRRAEEAQSLTQAGREENVEFTCTVAEVLTEADAESVQVRCLEGEVSEDGVQAGGVVVELDAIPELTVGMVLEVTGRTGAGRVLATAAVVTPGQPVARATAAASATPQAEPTLTPPPATDAPEEPAAEPAVATDVPAPPATEPPLSPVPPTDEPPPTPEPTRPSVVEWTGQLESVGPEVWVVAGQAFRRGTGRIDEAVGPAKPGASVHVRAERRDGDLWLIELIVTAPAAEPEGFELAGTIDAVEDGAVVVDGQRLVITDDTQIAGELVVGHLARVRGLRYPDGRLEAVDIVVEVPEAPEEHEWSGIIEQIDEDFWLIDRRRVFLDADTEISGDPRLGARVDVRARRRDGAWWAVRLEVKSMAGVNQS